MRKRLRAQIKNLNVQPSQLPLMSWSCYNWCAVFDDYRDGCGSYRIFGDFQGHSAGSRIDGPWLVEDKISNAIIDELAVIILDGLHGVSVMADEAIGPSIDELVRFHNLLSSRICHVLHAPVEAHNNAASRILLLEHLDAVNNFLKTLLAHAWLVWQIGSVFQCQSQRCY